MMSVGDAKPATDEDFNKLKIMINDGIGWNLVFSKDKKFVWTKMNEISAFQIIKIQAVYKDISASNLYDTLHDPLYRTVWDPTILEGKEICKINATSDIGYYAMQLPKPFANRDFLTVRSWKEVGREKYIINHSINHASMPIRKSFIRGMSYLTGYLVISDHDNTAKEGCTLNYITQSDPKGNLPVWVVNKATQWLAPKVIEKLYVAAKGYTEWKKKNDPSNKPWIFPHQQHLPTVQSKDILTMEDVSIDDDDLFESFIMEEDYANVDMDFSTKP